MALGMDLEDDLRNHDANRTARPGARARSGTSTRLWTRCGESHTYDPEVAVRLICWFPPDRGTVVVALFAADKARLADPQLAAGVAAAHADTEEMDRVNAMNLAMIRKTAQMTQVEVARKLGVGQGVVSRLEHRDDMLLSTLHDYLMATGAEGASIVVTVHGHRIELDLSGLRNAPPEQQSALSSPSPTPRDTASEPVHVAAHGQRQSTYAQLRSWIAACRPRGTFRGTVFWPIPAQRVPSVRSFGSGKSHGRWMSLAARLPP